MSIIISGMKMPKGCLECPFKDIGMSTMTQCLLVAGWVEYANDGYGIPDACPLVELPEKHGRLIDESTVLEMIRKSMCIKDLSFLYNAEKSVVNQIYHASTIIEAEGGEDDG